REAGDVEPAVMLVARLVEIGSRAGDAERADREVDVEDPAPPGVLGEDSADERADRDREADRRAPDPEGGAALASVELLGEDRERDGEHHGSADSLEPAREIEEERRGRDAAE